MNHHPERDVDDRLADWVDGCMNARDRDRFVAELRVNPQLQKDLDQYERTVSTVRRALQAPTARVDVAGPVMAAIAAQQQRPEKVHVGGRVYRMFFSLAAAAALLALAVWLNGLPSGRSSAPADPTTDWVASAGPGDSMPELPPDGALAMKPARKSLAPGALAEAPGEAETLGGVVQEALQYSPAGVGVHLVVPTGEGAKSEVAGGDKTADDGLAKRKDVTVTPGDNPTAELDRGILEREAGAAARMVTAQPEGSSVVEAPVPGATPGTAVAPTAVTPAGGVPGGEALAREAPTTAKSGSSTSRTGSDDFYLGSIRQQAETRELGVGQNDADGAPRRDEATSLLAGGAVGSQPQVRMPFFSVTSVAPADEVRRRGGGGNQWGALTEPGAAAPGSGAPGPGASGSGASAPGAPAAGGPSTPAPSRGRAGPPQTDELTLFLLQELAASVSTAGLYAAESSPSVRTIGLVQFSDVSLRMVPEQPVVDSGPLPREAKRSAEQHTADLSAKAKNTVSRERSWLVEGPKADVAAVLQRVAELARKSGLEQGNGEVRLTEEMPSAESPKAKSPAAGQAATGLPVPPASSATQPAPDADRQRVVLRFLTLPRK